MKFCVVFFALSYLTRCQFVRFNREGIEGFSLSRCSYQVHPISTVNIKRGVEITVFGWLLSLAS